MKANLQALVEQRIIDDYPKYYRLAYRYLHQEADAQDAVQEAAYKAILNCRTLRNPAYMDTWLYRIVVNEALTLLRARQRWSQDETALELESTEDRYEDIDLLRAVEDLGEPDRTIVTLRYFEDLKLSEVALVVQMPLNSVKTRLYRALKRLRTTLEED